MAYVDALPAPMTFFAFALVALGMVLTPGPNMIYLVSRSIAQGRRAGLVSLLPGRRGLRAMREQGRAATFEEAVRLGADGPPGHP